MVICPLDLTARYFSAAGSPLLTAPELAAWLAIDVRTVYHWRRRTYITVAGRDDEGRQLFDAGEVAVVAATPRRRKAAA